MIIYLKTGDYDAKWMITWKQKESWSSPEFCNNMSFLKFKHFIFDEKGILKW